MPNHIKNRIEFTGSSKKVKELVDAFSTFFERTPSKTHDDELLIYKTKGGNFGWYDPVKDEFKKSESTKKTKGVPIGYEQEFEEAWTRFPDFEKIKPLPLELKIDSSSVGELALNLLFGHSERFDFLSLPEKQKIIRDLTPERLQEEIKSAIVYWNNIQAHGFKTWYDWSVKNWGTKWNAYSCEKVSDNIYDFDTAWSGVPELIEIMSEKFPGVKIIYKYSDEDTGSNCGVGEYNGGEIYFREIEEQSKEAYELAFELRPDRAENYKLVGSKYEYVEQD